MNIRLILASAAFALSLSSCIVPLPILGGGVAGAAMDPLWLRQGAENYRGYTSPEITVTRYQDPEMIAQFLREVSIYGPHSNLFSHFPIRASVRDDFPTELGGVFVTHHQQQIRVAKQGQVIVTESIPSAFYSPGFDAGSFRIRGVPYFLLATYSRSSTHMVWIGFYRGDGTRLYLATRPIRDIWHVVPSPNGFTIVGDSDCTRIFL